MATETMKSQDIKKMFPNHGKKMKRSRHLTGSVGDELDAVEGDKIVRTDVTENKRRRTIILQRSHGTWGFTLQSYGLHHRNSKEVEILTYVDYVEVGGPGYLAGLQAGDVILSINGTNMEQADHNALVQYIKDCGSTMRMVVLFEDCCKKVELHLRYIRLKRVLAEKIFEVRSLEQQEKRVLSGFSRFDSCRSSVASTMSSSMSSVFDDRLSLNFEINPNYKSSVDRDRSISTPNPTSPLARDHPVSPLVKDSSKSFSETLHSTSPDDKETSPFSRDESTASLHSVKSAAPFFGPRFDFDRASLPINTRLKPQLRPHNSFPVSCKGGGPVLRHSSGTRLERSVLLRESLNPEFHRGIPEDRSSSLRRPASTPGELGPGVLEMNMYKLSLNNNPQLHLGRGHSAENLYAGTGVRPKVKTLPLAVSSNSSKARSVQSDPIRTEAAVHHYGTSENSSPDGTVNGSIHDVDINDIILLSNASSDKSDNQRSASYSLFEDLIPPSGGRCDTDASSGGHYDSEAPSSGDYECEADQSECSETSGAVFIIGSPVRSSSPILGGSPTSPSKDQRSVSWQSSVLESPIRSNNQTSPKSPPDRGMSRDRHSSVSLAESTRFSYSDLPCMDVSFLNEKDEITKL